MDGGVLSKNIVVPNFEERRDSLVGSGLGISSYYSTLRELIILSDFGPLSYGDVRLQYASFTNLCLPRCTKMVRRSRRRQVPHSGQQKLGDEFEASVSFLGNYINLFSRLVGVGEFKDHLHLGG